MAINRAEQAYAPSLSIRPLLPHADHADAPAGNNAPAAGSDGPPRCKSWKTGGPSLAAILLRFCNEHPRHNDYVRLFT